MKAYCHLRGEMDWLDERRGKDEERGPAFSCRGAPAWKGKLEMSRAVSAIRIASCAFAHRRTPFAASRAFACASPAASGEASAPTSKEEKALRSCWKCGAKVPTRNLFCPSSSCHVVQLLKLNETNLFGLFDLPETFFLDEKKLDQAFKQLQNKLHPDKVGAKGKEEVSVSTESSSVANVAYEVDLRNHLSLPSCLPPACASFGRGLIEVVLC